MVFADAFAKENGLDGEGLRRAIDMYERQRHLRAYNIGHPAGDEERMIVAEALCLFRNRKLIPDWEAREFMDSAALEELARRSEEGGTVTTEREGFQDVLLWARSRRSGPA